MKPVTISVLGLGYIGLPTALLLAQNKNNFVQGFDLDQKKIKKLKGGKLPFEENGLDKVFKKINEQNNFTASTKLVAADIYLIAVPTPNKAGASDLKFVQAALQSIQSLAKAGDIVILESTVAPEDCQLLEKQLSKWSVPVHFVHCPERAIPGNTLGEMCGNTRIVGSRSPEVAEKIESMYRSFVTSEIKHTDPVTAACVKLMENTFRAVNIALANEFVSIADDLKINVWEAISLANAHPRVNIHLPGPGVGGHCIPIDPWFFVDAHKNTEVIEKSLLANQSMPKYVVRSFNALIKKNKLKVKKVVVLGVAYKKDVDDWRESPAIEIQKLLENKYVVQASDPLVTDYEFKVVPTEKALQSADSVILVTDHSQYADLDFSQYKNLQLIYDTRNCLSSTQLAPNTLLRSLGKQ